MGHGVPLLDCLHFSDNSVTLEVNITQPLVVGDYVNPGQGPFDFPDYQRFGLRRDSRGRVIAVSAEGRITITVDWNPTGQPEVGIYAPAQLMPAIVYRRLAGPPSDRVTSARYRMARWSAP